MGHLACHPLRLGCRGCRRVRSQRTIATLKKLVRITEVLSKQHFSGVL